MAKKIILFVVFFASHTLAAGFDFSATRALGIKKVISGSNGVQINTYFYSKGLAKKIILVSPGWSEPALLYLEFVKDFLEEGYDVAVIDHRGQGESGRFIDCECSHVDSYENYINDLEIFIQDVKKRSKYSQVVLFGHSMGGAIAALAVYRGIIKVDQLVLSAPLFEVNTREIPLWVARALAWALVQLGQGEKRRPFDKDRTPEFVTNKWTQSEARWTYAKKTGDSLSAPKIRYFTNQWLSELFKMTDEIQAAIRSSQLIVVPTLLLQAENDLYVSNSIQDNACVEKTPVGPQSSGDCHLVKIKGSWHSLFLDIDSVRSAALEATKTFLKKASERSL